MFGGYLYFHYAPSREEFQRELVRKVTRLHEYDVLRANKVGFGGNIEIRAPFLDKDLLEVAMNIDPTHKMCDSSIMPDRKNKKIEKYILRKAFDTEDYQYLPDSVLWR